jgi:hypothetical protein
VPSENCSGLLHSPIATNTGKTVHMELRRSGGETLLHLVNPERLWNDRAPKQRHVAVSIGCRRV